MFKTLVACIRVQKMALLGPAVCSQCIIEHFVKNSRTHILPASITPLERCKKIDSSILLVDNQ